MKIIIVVNKQKRAKIVFVIRKNRRQRFQQKISQQHLSRSIRLNKWVKITFLQLLLRWSRKRKIPQIDGKSTKRKRPLQVASLEGEALISRELDSQKALQRLAERVCQMEMALVCLIDKSLPPPPPHSDPPICEKPARNTELIQPLTINTPEPQVHNLINVQANTPTINNHIPQKIRSQITNSPKAQHYQRINVMTKNRTDPPQIIQDSEDEKEIIRQHIKMKQKLKSF